MGLYSIRLGESNAPVADPDSICSFANLWNGMAWVFIGLAIAGGGLIQARIGNRIAEGGNDCRVSFG